MRSAPNDLAYRAASLSARIRAQEPNPAQWKPLIEAAPEDIRELVRIYLTQAYRGMRHKEQAAREKGGPVAAAEIQKLRERLG